MSSLSVRAQSPVSNSSPTAQRALRPGSPDKEATQVFFVKETKTETSFFGLFRKQVTRLHLSKLENGQVVRVDKVGIKTNRGFFETLFGKNKAHVTINLSGKSIRHVQRKGQNQQRVSLDTLSEEVNATSLASFFGRLNGPNFTARQLSNKNAFDVGATVQGVAQAYLQSQLALQGNQLVQERSDTINELRERLQEQVNAAEERDNNLSAELLAARRNRTSPNQLKDLEAQATRAHQNYENLYQALNTSREQGAVINTEQLGGRALEIANKLNQLNANQRKSFNGTRVDSFDEAHEKIARAARVAHFEWIKAPE